MSINDQITQLIAAAKAAGLTEGQVTDEITIRWGAQGDSQLKLDEYGRHSIAGSKHLFLSPLPILFGMTLTKLQLTNIQVECSVAPDGTEQEAAFLGFDGYPIAYLAARRHELGDKQGTDHGPFKPRTFRSRFRTLDEAVAYVAANAWVQ